MRRTRIKAIANIPLRKNADKTQKVDESKINKLDEVINDKKESKQSTELLNEENNETPIEKNINSTQINKNKVEISILENVVLKDSKEASFLFKQSCTDIDLVKSKERKISLSEIKQDLVQDSNINALLNSSKTLTSPITRDIKLHLTDLPSHPININSNLEYPLPPESPNKLNRNRIKAVPRIGYRKISFSASESEDENKKNVKSIQGLNILGKQEILTEQPVLKEFSSVIQRKCKRTEWSRKLAEARREFTRKFTSGKLDHKKLTMIDLIFYNPPSNHLKKEGKESITENHECNDEISEKLSEDEDNPDETEKSILSDEENEIPAPQIKIGPTGEIILDEKSLVIESEETKKNREELQKSKLVDGNADRSYGVYKRVKKTKDWANSETLRFYKALSTVGTDFSLMCELFPERTRRELKMKFKKEERINRSLIDQAVMQPCNFDFQELKREFELDDIEKQHLKKQTSKNDKKDAEENKKSVKFSHLTQENCKQKKIGNKRKKHKNLSESDSTDDNECDNKWRPIQTRYGRKIKKRHAFNPEPNLEDGYINNKESEDIQKPGSITMVSSQTPQGEPVIEIFMVTDKNDKSNNSQKLLSIAMIKESQPNEENMDIENNYTIAAEPENSITNDDIENKLEI